MNKKTLIENLVQLREMERGKTYATGATNVYDLVDDVLRVFEAESMAREGDYDPVQKPPHYMLEGLDIESVDVIKAVLGQEGFRKFCRGNALKYLIRADNKGGVMDLMKAAQYLEWEIAETGVAVEGKRGEENE